MINQPKISVVMSVYNGAEFLSQSIESILQQTFKDFEFIIIDDASTDNSWEILQNFNNKDKRIKLIKNEKNIGIEGFIKNLNFGCEIATGKYIARMDQDDISRIDRFQLQFEFLESNPDIFILGSWVDRIDRFGKSLGVIQTPLNNKEISKMMPKRISLFHPATIFRNKFYQNFYREKIRYCEDYDFYLRIMTDSLKMANLKDIVLEYRILENSMSRKQDKVIKNLFINKVKEFYRERLETGKDSYDTFDPAEYLNIYTNPSKSTVRKSINVSKKYYDYKGFEKMLKIYKDINRDIFYFKNRLLLLFGESFFNLNAKFMNKINRY